MDFSTLERFCRVPCPLLKGHGTGDGKAGLEIPPTSSFRLPGRMAERPLQMSVGGRALLFIS